MFCLSEDVLKEIVYIMSNFIMMVIICFRFGDKCG